MFTKNKKGKKREIREIEISSRLLIISGLILLFCVGIFGGGAFLAERYAGELTGLFAPQPNRPRDSGPPKAVIPTGMVVRQIGSQGETVAEGFRFYLSVDEMGQGFRVSRQDGVLGLANELGQMIYQSNARYIAGVNGPFSVTDYKGRSAFKVSFGETGVQIVPQPERKVWVEVKPLPDRQAGLPTATPKVQAPAALTSLPASLMTAPWAPFKYRPGDPKCSPNDEASIRGTVFEGDRKVSGLKVVVGNLSGGWTNQEAETGMSGVEGFFIFKLRPIGSPFRRDVWLVDNDYQAISSSVRFNFRKDGDLACGDAVVNFQLW